MGNFGLILNSKQPNRAGFCMLVDERNAPVEKKKEFEEEYDIGNE